ncbi:hypothetical protein [Capnocytophaga bilenii]|jgi:hypothetical protein
MLFFISNIWIERKFLIPLPHLYETEIGSAGEQPIRDNTDVIQNVDKRLSVLWQPLFINILATLYL